VLDILHATVVEKKCLLKIKERNETKVDKTPMIELFVMQEPHNMNINKVFQKMLADVAKSTVDHNLESENSLVDGVTNGDKPGRIPRLVLPEPGAVFPMMVLEDLPY